MSRARSAIAWLLAFLGALAVTILAAMLVGIPAEDLPALAWLLVSAGGLTGLAAALLLRPAILGRAGGIRWQLMGAGLFSSLLLLAMLLASARAMFISEHDLSVMLTMLLFAGLLAVGISWLAADSMAGRVERVREATRRLAGGELAGLPALDISGHDEIAELARDFNRMADSLQQATLREREVEAARRNLIAAVSHDLRTPLAAVRALIEAMADEVVTDAEVQRRYLGIAQREVQHLSNLVDDLFELARIDAGALRLQEERASLRDLVSDTLASFQQRAERQGVNLAGAVASDVDPVFIDAAKVQRVLSNLLENALRHTPPGGAIQLISSRRGDGVVEVEVADTGQGIAPEDLPHVFERAYRGDPARARQENGPAGAGLGLTIARGLVEAHGGTIRVESALGSGTRICFTLRSA